MSAPLDSSSFSTLFEYDERIAGLNAQLVTLKRKRNHLLLLYRMPIEILARILQHYQTSSSGKHDAGLFHPTPTFNYRWMRVMLVCRHFRLVAVSAPELWSTIHGELPWERKHDKRTAARTALHVERARAVPLVLNGYGGHLEGLLEKAQIANMAMLDRVNCPAPLLRELCLRDCALVDGSLLGAHGENLTRLSLRRLILEGLPSLPSVSHLCLYDIELPDKEFSTLIDSLKQTPNLEVLATRALKLAKPLHINSPYDVIMLRESVSLPKLRVIQVEDYPPYASAILRLVSSFKSTLHVKILHKKKWSSGLHVKAAPSYGSIFDRSLDIWGPCLPEDITPACTLFFMKTRTSSGPANSANQVEFKIQIGNPFKLNEDDIAVENIIGSADLKRVVRPGPFLFCSTDSFTSNIDTRKDFISKWLPASLSQVVLQDITDDKDFSKVAIILRERARRSTRQLGLLGRTQPFIVIDAIDCSDRGNDIVRGWLDDRELMVKDVMIGTSDNNSHVGLHG
jgi:hypothetical protein